MTTSDTSPGRFYGCRFRVLGTYTIECTIFSKRSTLSQILELYSLRRRERPPLVTSDSQGDSPTSSSHTPLPIHCRLRLSPAQSFSSTRKTETVTSFSGTRSVTPIGDLRPFLCLHLREDLGDLSYVDTTMKRKSHPLGEVWRLEGLTFYYVT